MKPKTKRARGFLIAGAILAVLVLLAGLFLAGIIRVNTPSRADYPVWGVDVSEYQGDIDWPALEAQGVRFAFIRATEGSAYTDRTFAANWAGVADTGILAGAYHFFSFDSPAAAQAENFLAAVPPGGPMLPPVVDVELYGAHKQSPPEAEAVRRQLDELLAALEAECGAKPVLYATGRAHRLYLAGHYEDHPVWIRDVYLRPTLADGRAWTFWQYSDKGRLAGYAGEEKYIDLNVYAGSGDELERMLVE